MTEKPFTLEDLDTVERIIPPKWTPEQEAAFYTTRKELSPIKKNLGMRMMWLHHEIERQRKAIESRARSAHDEMLRVMIACRRGETQIWYTAWADDMKVELEKLNDMEKQYQTLEHLAEEDDVVVVDSETAAPLVERLTKIKEACTKSRSVGYDLNAGGRNAKLRDDGRVQVIENDAKIKLIDELLGVKGE